MSTDQKQLEVAKQYVDTQLATMKKYGSEPREMSTQEYRSLVQEVADTQLSWLTLNPPFKVQLLGKGRKWRTCPLWENTVKHLRHLIEHRRLTDSNECLFVDRFGQAKQVRSPFAAQE